ANANPTDAFRAETEQWLRQTVRQAYSILHHWAAIRPATIDRRPLVGMHPTLPRVGILNGMGTKGVSLAPFFGKQLAQHLLDGASIMPDADIQRFERILKTTW
ncbi:MAG: FAD-binding oxidoreductase, partial [Bacteroidetes bacterium]